MAFLRKAGSILSQTTGRQINSEIYGADSSIFHVIRSMSSAKVFVGGLSWNTTEQILGEACSRYGDVLEAKVIIDRDSQRSKGFGFVTFANAEAASAAIQAMDQQELDGRRVRVNYATEKPRYGGGGGNYNQGWGNYNQGGGNYNQGVADGYTQEFNGSGGGGGGYGGGGNYNQGGGNYSQGVVDSYSQGPNISSGSGGEFGTGNQGFGTDSYVNSDAGANTSFGTTSSGFDGGDNITGGALDQEYPVTEENLRDDDNEPADYAKRV